MRAGGRTVGALAALVFLTCVLTWPWPTDPAGRIVGSPGGDNWGSMALWTAIGDCSSPFDARIPCIAWPDGSGNAPGVQVASLFSSMFYWGGTEAWGAVATHGLMVFSGLLLTGIFAFLLVRRATGSTAAGLVAGVAFESTQHLVSMANAAAVYTHGWVTLVPLAVWWLVASSPSRRNAIFAGLSVVPAAFWSPYPAEHALIVWAACAFVVVVETWEAKRRVAALWAWSVVPVAAVLAIGIAIRASFASDIPIRAATDAYPQALWPFLLLKPSLGSFVWGDGPNRIVTSFMPSAYTAGVYMGIVVLGLAISGALLTFRRPQAVRRTRRAAGATGADDDRHLPALRAGATHLRRADARLADRVDRTRTARRPALHGADQRLRRHPGGCRVESAGAVSRHGAGGRRPVLVAALIVVDGYVRFDDNMTRTPKPSPALAALERAPDGPVLHLPWGFENLRETSRPCLIRRYEQPLVNTCHRETRSSVGQVVAYASGSTRAGASGRHAIWECRYVIADRVNPYTDEAVPRDPARSGLSPPPLREGRRAPARLGQDQGRLGVTLRATVHDRIARCWMCVRLPARRRAQFRASQLSERVVRHSDATPRPRGKAAPPPRDSTTSVRPLGEELGSPRGAPQASSPRFDVDLDAPNRRRT